MSYYLIGIGGTGARCMEAFIHLNSAGLLKDKEAVNLIYVDADVSCGNLTKTQNVARYYKVAKDKVGFSRSAIFKNELVGERFVWNPVKEGEATMDVIFAKSLLLNKTATKPLGLLYTALFDEQERSTNLDKGFRGHPAIGATVVNLNMKEDEAPWNKVLQKINSDKAPKVFLFASVFGGTGAAGFPNIARLLRDVVSVDDKGNCHASIAGALILPYFQIPLSDAENAMELQAKTEEFMINTKAALDYYNKNGLLDDVFTTIYAIGDHESVTVDNFALGADSQRNRANLVEMYAALAAFDFFNKASDELEKGKVPLISHASEDVINWSDLPGVGGTEIFTKKFQLLIKFLYVYKRIIYPEVMRCMENPKHMKTLTWYKELVQDKGNLDPINNQEHIDLFKYLDQYATAFFAWLYDIIYNQKRNVNFVNRDIFNADGTFNQESRVNLYDIITTDTVKGKNGEDLSKVVVQTLHKYAPKGNEFVGIEILIQALEELCESQGGKV